MLTKITLTNEIWPTKITPKNEIWSTKIAPTNKCRQSMTANKTFITETSKVVYVLKPF
jgi:hypothetical protein